MLPLRDNIPSKTWPVVNTGFIILNAIIFILEMKLLKAGTLSSFIDHWALIPAQLTLFPLENFSRIISSMFMHGGWAHFLGNMLYLYIFGDNVEDRIGHLRYIVFYLLCGVLATLVQVYFNPNSEVPMIGASGAIAGVLGAYFILYPRAKVMVMIPIFIFIRIIEVPAFLVLGLWFALQAWSGKVSLEAKAVMGDVGGVAWWAHSGGFIAGLILVLFFTRFRRKKRR